MARYGHGHPVGGAQTAVVESCQRRVLAVCGVDVGGGTLLATGGDDGTVRLWDPVALSKPPSWKATKAWSGPCAR